MLAIKNVFNVVYAMNDVDMISQVIRCCCDC